MTEKEVSKRRGPNTKYDIAGIRAMAAAEIPCRLVSQKTGIKASILYQIASRNGFSFKRESEYARKKKRFRPDPRRDILAAEKNRDDTRNRMRAKRAAEKQAPSNGGFAVELAAAWLTKKLVVSHAGL